MGYYIPNQLSWEDVLRTSSFLTWRQTKQLVGSISDREYAQNGAHCRLTGSDHNTARLPLSVGQNQGEADPDGEAMKDEELCKRIFQQAARVSVQFQ